jgi:hypothetical protein
MGEMDGPYLNVMRLSMTFEVHWLAIIAGFGDQQGTKACTSLELSDQRNASYPLRAPSNSDSTDRMHCIGIMLAHLVKF